MKATPLIKFLSTWCPSQPAVAELSYILDFALSSSWLQCVSFPPPTCTSSWPQFNVCPLWRHLQDLSFLHLYRKHACHDALVCVSLICKSLENMCSSLFVYLSPCLVLCLARGRWYINVGQLRME